MSGRFFFFIVRLNFSTEERGGGVHREEIITSCGDPLTLALVVERYLPALELRASGTGNETSRNGKMVLVLERFQPVLVRLRRVLVGHAGLSRSFGLEVGAKARL